MPGGPIVVVEYDPGWPGNFGDRSRALREALGPVARRIDHVGSTAVPGIAAKPVIDIQLSVQDLAPEEAYRTPLERLGYRLLLDNPDRSKRFFDGPADGPATHLHVRRVGSFDEQLNLLFRDYLRTHPADAREYARVKRELAGRFRDDRPGYVRAKEPTVWAVLRSAHDWAQSAGWAPGPSDA